MKGDTGTIDIQESVLRRAGNLLDVLLLDRTTGKNILWATDSYEVLFDGRFAPRARITPDLVTGRYKTLIQPRAVKSPEEQKRRTKEKAEVFTPLFVVRRINQATGALRNVSEKEWQGFVRELRLEITCGEAPFIASRYDPTAKTGKLIPIAKRVGFLDAKLRAVSKYCVTKRSWIFWAKEAFKASYGYEWQGDNVLLARENLLYTMIDYYKEKFGSAPTVRVRKSFADIISWNVFQMDGLRCVVPMSCYEEEEAPISPLPFEGQKETVSKKVPCQGCARNRLQEHNGEYVKIMDWRKKRKIKFTDIFAGRV